MSTNWETDLSPAARRIMDELGGFRPTADASQRALHGRAPDVYWTSRYLTDLAIACLDAADWLDARAEKEK